jgi:hypothetical protein
MRQPHTACHDRMRQSHSSARHCDSVVMSSHADTASRSIELNDSDSVAIANDTLSSCRHTLTLPHGQQTVHTATRVTLSSHAARNSDSVVVSSHAHTQSPTRHRAHAAATQLRSPLRQCHGVITRRHRLTQHRTQRQRLRRHRQRHTVIVSSHTDVVSLTRNRRHSDSGHAQLPCGSR